MAPVISANRDTMMRVVDTWETCPPEEKDKILKQFVDDVELNLNNQAYKFKADVLADMEVIKKLHSIFQPPRMKHREDICRVLLDRSRAIQDMLKIQVLMEDMLSTGKGEEIKKWMLQKMENAGSKKFILKYLHNSEDEEKSLIHSLDEMGAKVENLKRVKQVDTSRGFRMGKCTSVKTETKKDRLALMKKYQELEEKFNCASSEYTKLCEIELPFSECSRKVRECLARLKKITEYQMYELK